LPSGFSCLSVEFRPGIVKGELVDERVNELIPTLTHSWGLDNEGDIFLELVREVLQK